MRKKIVVAICGASGSIYGIRLLKALLNMPVEVCLIISNMGFKVLEHETGYKKKESFEKFLIKNGIKFNKDSSLKIFNQDDF